MNNRDMFIDLVDELDVKHIDSHIRRVTETKKQKIARYATAGAIYAAACIVVVLAIPLIIGGGNDSPVVPGTDPIVIETVDTGTETETAAPEETTAVETTAESETTVGTTELVTETTVLSTETTAESTTTETTATEATTPPPETTAPAPVVELGEGEYLNGNFVMKGSGVVKYVGNEKHVVIPEGVTSVADGAFDGCTSVKSITLASTTWEFNTEAFAGCPNLTELTVADGHSSYYSAYGFVLYQSGGSIKAVPPGITELYIPAGIDGVYSVGLSHCTKLEKVTVDPAHETYESYGSVLYTKGRTKLLYIPPMLTECNIPAETAEIEISGTYYCRSLKKYNVDPANTKFSSIDGAIYTDKGKTLVRVPNAMSDFTFASTAKSAWQYSFWENRGITHLTVPANVEVGAYSNAMFAGCRSLEAITIEKFTAVPKDLFLGCASLKSIVIPEGVGSIGESAFNGCISLETVSIPSTVMGIKDTAFANTNSLREIKVASGNVSYVSVNGVLYTKDMKTLVRYAGTGAEYIIPDGVEEVGAWSFSGHSILKSVVIPGSVKSVKLKAFYECSNLERAEVRTGVGSMQSLVFARCPKLSYLYIGDNVELSGFNDTTANSPNAVIYGSAGSTAAQYAANAGVPFVPVG